MSRHAINCDYIPVVGSGRRSLRRLTNVAKQQAVHQFAMYQRHVWHHHCIKRDGTKTSQRRNEKALLKSHVCCSSSSAVHEQYFLPLQERKTCAPFKVCISQLECLAARCHHVPMLCRPLYPLGGALMMGMHRPRIAAAACWLPLLDATVTGGDQHIDAYGLLRLIRPSTSVLHVI